MFPIRDHNPSQRRPFVVYGLIALNALIFLMQLPYMGDVRALAGFWADRALYPALVTDYGDYTGIFTSMFLHAGWMHIIGNMLWALRSSTSPPASPRPSPTSLRPPIPSCRRSAPRAPSPE
jgi:membrane associated rhomboid family serine protease